MSDRKNSNVIREMMKKDEVNGEVEKIRSNVHRVHET